MKKRKKLKVKNILILISILVIIVILLFNMNKANKYDVNIKNILDNTQKEVASINKIRIYGNHLNISGTLEEKKVFLDNIDDAKIVFKNVDGKDIKLDVDYNVNNKGNLTFSTYVKINNGINLDKLNIGNYIMLLELKEMNYNTESFDTKYYKLFNNDDTKRFDYYTVTNNNKNNKIIINNYAKEMDEEKYKYTSIKIEDVTLPSDIYDIVIDAGHGGGDSGAIKGEYVEKDITLDYALLLKDSLEKKGYKVKLTRDGTNEDELGTHDMYGDDGRVVIANNVKAKLAFSIHLNSAEYNINTGGLEIYVPNNADTSLAKNVADNIVASASTTYSPSETYKVDDGVYLRTFSSYEIEQAKKDAISKGFEPYNITTDTTYYFFIRETGGLNTNAYVDGRNKDYGKNKYYNSAIGVESYLVELGYMVSESDLNNIVNNKEGYVSGFTNAVDEYLKNGK